jgi:CheY-like chemotaxis protein
MAGLTLLLADDSITIQKVVGIIFGADDYTLHVVDNGRDAIRRAGELKPDIMLIDAVMPDMDGYEVSQTLRVNPALRDRPILLLCGSFDPFDPERAKNAGIDDHLVKPFESQQLIAKVENLHRRGRSGQRLSGMLERERTPATPVSVDDPWGSQSLAPPASLEPFLRSEPVAHPVDDQEVEQLRRLLTSMSQETVERIVREIVPGMAEQMIREAIERITKGR